MKSKPGGFRNRHPGWRQAEVDLRVAVPGGAPGAFDEIQRPVKPRGGFVFLADVQPDRGCAALAGMLQPLLGQAPGNAPPAVIGVHGHVRD